MNPINRLVLLALFFLLSAPSLASAQSVPELAKKALAATVSLEMQDSNGDILGQGSGFFVRPNLIVTNYHVIDGASRGYAKLVNTAIAYPINGFTAADKTYDLALLKVSIPGVTPLPVGDSHVVQIGESVYVAGNPQGLEGTFSDGIISGRRDKGRKKERLQMTAPISPGSSGGPVLNRKGEVIGVSTSLYNPIFGVNLAFAVPSNALTALLRRPQKIKPLSSQTPSVSAETYRARAYASIQLGNYEKAIRELDQALRMNPNYANAYYNRGSAKRNLGQHSAAIADYDEAIRLDPNDANAYFNRGHAKGELGRHPAAITDYDEAIRLNPNYAHAYFGRGLARSKLYNAQAAFRNPAREDFRTALRLATLADNQNLKARIEKELRQLDQ